MKRGDITKLAEVAGCSVSFMASVLRPGNPKHRHPCVKKAKLLAETTGTDPWVWLEGTPEEIRAAIEEAERERIRRLNEMADAQAKACAGGF